MVCKMCGNELGRDAKDCDRCGKKVDAFCPKCNAKVVEGYGYCGSCWFDLSGTGAKSELPPPQEEELPPPRPRPTEPPPQERTEPLHTAQYTLPQPAEASPPEHSEQPHTTQHLPPQPEEEAWEPPFRTSSFWDGSFFMWRLKLGVIILVIGFVVSAIMGIANAISHGVGRIGQANHALVGSWDWHGEAFYVFNSDGTGTRDGRNISWRVSRGELHVCRSGCRGCAQNCAGRTRRYFTVDGASLTLTHTNVPEITFNYTRTGYHTGPPEPTLTSEQTAQALVGTWDSQTGRFHYIFNSDGTGVNPVSDFYWWVSDRGVLYRCTSPERCQGNCTRPNRYRLLLDGDTLRWENIHTRGIGHYARVASPQRTEGLVGDWLVDGGSLLTFNADGRGTRAGMDISWWTRDGRLYLCSSPNNCRGNCPAPEIWYYELDGDSVRLSDDLGAIYLTRLDPPPITEGLLGSWYMDDTMAYTFNADGTGLDPEGEFSWRMGNDGTLLLCFKPEPCRNRCHLPLTVYYTMNEDDLTLSWDSEIHAFVRR